MRLFLSHSSSDAALALELAGRLRTQSQLRAAALAAGHGDPEVLLSAHLEGTEEARDALRTVDAVLVLLGKSEPGPWREVEWQYVLEESWRRPSLVVVTLKQRHADVPRFLLGRERVELGSVPLLAGDRIAEQILAARAPAKGDSLLRWLLAPARVAELEAESAQFGREMRTSRVARWWRWLRGAASFGGSSVLHALLVWFLFRWIWTEAPEPRNIALHLETAPEVPALEPTPEPSRVHEDEEPEPVEEPDLDLVADDDPVDPVPLPPADVLRPVAGPFDSPTGSDITGLRGGAGGGAPSARAKYSGRGRGGGSPQTQEAVRHGLDWLARHQDPGGRWDCGGFAKNCGPDLCSGPGASTNDVGVTALATLAFLGSGNSTVRGPYRAQVDRAVQYLLAQQDAESGRIGPAFGASIYCHSLATMALIETMQLGNLGALRAPCQKAVDYLHHARHPYGAWRYDVPNRGASDLSVTGWVLFALFLAKDAGLDVDTTAIRHGMSFVDEVSDPRTGRAGYTSRTDSLGFPRSESTTAIAALLRIFQGETIGSSTTLRRAVDRLLENPPQFVPGQNDLYYWYYASYALWQVGGAAWQRWQKPLVETLVESQSSAGHMRGSWDPDCRWGGPGGRVYSTSMAVLCLEVYYRYAKLYGTR